MQYKICKYCGKKFFTLDKRNKYCSFSCSVAARQIHIKSVSITDREFNALWKQHSVFIKKILFKRSDERQFMEDYLQNAMITLWRIALKYRMKGIALEDIPIGYINKTISYIPTGSHSFTSIIVVRKYTNAYKNAKITDSADECLCLGDAQTEINQMNNFYDMSMPIDDRIDLQDLTKKILFDASQDENIKCAVVRGEIKSDSVFQKKDEIEQVVKEEYGINIKDRQEFQSKATIGVKKLWSLYCDEISACIGLRKEDLGFKPKENAFVRTLDVCYVCGKLFRPNPKRLRQITCSHECTKRLDGLKALQRDREKQREKLLIELEELRKEKKKILEELKTK